MPLWNALQMNILGMTDLLQGYTFFQELLMGMEPSGTTPGMFLSSTQPQNQTHKSSKL